MKSCCEAKSSELEILKVKQGKVLKIVLWINFVMFFLEFGFGILSGSAALMADSLDMLGDAAVYAFSLYVLASVLVGITNSKWPDIGVGAVIATLFLHSAFSVGKDALLDFQKLKEIPHET